MFRTKTQLSKYCGQYYIKRAKSHLKATAGSVITEESDFAFRKEHVKLTERGLQDQLYYPSMSDIKKQLTLMKLELKPYRVDQFVTEFRGLDKTLDSLAMLSGKISSIRKAGKGSYFIDIIQDYERVQLIVHHKVMGLEKDQFVDHHSRFRPGDQVIGVGFPSVTKVGELSLKLTKPLTLASPSLHPLPPKFNDAAKVNSNRIVNYLVNKKAKDVILARSRIIAIIRQFFDNRGFVEVETPIIGSGNTGANATPFRTDSVHLKDENNKPTELNLRVAPELWLKKLIISGFDQIFEISKVFRNEGIDSTHNPEFTTCEFYKTFASLDDLMTITEELFIHIIVDLKSNDKHGITHENCSKLLDAIETEGHGHFKKIDFIETLQNKTGLTLPDELTSELLIKFHADLKLKLPDVKSPYQLLDNLSSIYLEPLCGQCPTFIYNLPEILSPLAKSTLDREKRPISRRFELYINGKEYVNAYEEENNPFKQELKFKHQQLQKDQFRDEETIVPDYKFVEFMEWGMPPTGGWGLGIDRLVMLLTGSKRIDNVLPFGRLTDVLKH